MVLTEKKDECGLSLSYTDQSKSSLLLFNKVLLIRILFCFIATSSLRVEYNVETSSTPVHLQYPCPRIKIENLLPFVLFEQEMLPLWLSWSVRTPRVVHVLL